MARAMPPQVVESMRREQNGDRIETLARALYVETLARQRANAMGDFQTALDAIAAAETFYQGWEQHHAPRGETQKG